MASAACFFFRFGSSLPSRIISIHIACASNFPSKALKISKQFFASNARRVDSMLSASKCLRFLRNVATDARTVSTLPTSLAEELASDLVWAAERVGIVHAEN